MILLVAMVGSITLTLRDRGQVKRQNISSQNFIDAKNAIEKKKIKSVNIVPLQGSIAELTTKVDNLEKRLDRNEDRIDTLGNNDNPLAR